MAELGKQLLLLRWESHPVLPDTPINPEPLGWRGCPGFPKDIAHIPGADLMKTIGKNAVFKRLKMYSYCYHSLLCVYAQCIGMNQYWIAL